MKGLLTAFLPFVLANNAGSNKYPFEGARWRVTYDASVVEFMIDSLDGGRIVRRSPRRLAKLLFDHKMLVDGEPAKKWFNSWFPTSGIDSAVVEDLL